MNDGRRGAVEIDRKTLADALEVTDEIPAPSVRGNIHASDSLVNEFASCIETKKKEGLQHDAAVRSCLDEHAPAEGGKSRKSRRGKSRRGKSRGGKSKRNKRRSSRRRR